MTFLNATVPVQVRYNGSTYEVLQLRLDPLDVETLQFTDGTSVPTAMTMKSGMVHQVDLNIADTISALEAGLPATP
jgi:hypothetical protein